MSESMKPVRCRCIEGCWTSASRGCRTSPQKKKFRRLRESRSTVARQRARLLTRARAIIIYYRVFLHAQVHRCTSFIGRYSKNIMSSWRYFTGQEENLKIENWDKLHHDQILLLFGHVSFIICWRREISFFLFVRFYVFYVFLNLTHSE